MEPSFIEPHTKDLGGGFVVHRLLPSAQRQAVGPFLFFDHFGPLAVGPEGQHDVRPHPHIGLATVTYLLDGAMQHHDSTGAFQRIEPGAINWMSAGRGVVHSERRPADLRGVAYGLHGLQLWVALPEADETMVPSFEHTPAARIPALGLPGVALRVLVGSAHGLASPVATRSPTLFVDYRLAPDATVPLPSAADAAERAVYSVDEPVALQMGSGARIAVPPRTLVVLSPDDAPVLCASGTRARVVLIGGTNLGRRAIWWNFVATQPERIHAAACAWEADALGQVPGETERIPLPPRPARFA